jgi:hydrogenase maturation factor
MVDFSSGLNDFFFYLGALCAICDVNEYKKCVQEFKVPMVTTLFDTLHALCNLLLVLPENLKQVCTGDQLVRLTIKVEKYD